MLSIVLLVCFAPPQHLFNRQSEGEQLPSYSLHIFFHYPLKVYCSAP